MKQTLLSLLLLLGVGTQAQLVIPDVKTDNYNETIERYWDMDALGSSNWVYMYVHNRSIKDEYYSLFNRKSPEKLAEYFLHDIEIADYLDFEVNFLKYYEALDAQLYDPETEMLDEHIHFQTYSQNDTLYVFSGDNDGAMTESIQNVGAYYINPNESFNNVEGWQQFLSYDVVNGALSKDNIYSRIVYNETDRQITVDKQDGLDMLVTIDSLNNAGQIISSYSYQGVDSASLSINNKRIYEYDSEGRIKKIYDLESSDDFTTYSYSTNTKTEKIVFSNGNDSVENVTTYDNIGRVVEISKYSLVSDVFIKYTTNKYFYDASGNINKIECSEYDEDMEDYYDNYVEITDSTYVLKTLYEGVIYAYDSTIIKRSYIPEEQTGILENAISVSNDNFKIVPNPADEFIMVVGDKKSTYMQMEIISMNGISIKKELIATDKVIDITSVSPGVYIVKLSSEMNEFITSKMLIVKQ